MARIAFQWDDDNCPAGKQAATPQTLSSVSTCKWIVKQRAKQNFLDEVQFAP